MAIIKDAVARRRKAFSRGPPISLSMSGGANPDALLRRTALVAVVMGALLAAFVYLTQEAPLAIQNLVFYLVVVPFAAETGAAMGFLVRRPRAGAWAFGLTVTCALAANLGHALFVDSRAYAWGSYDWAAVDLSSLLNSLLVAAPAGALGYLVGLGRPSGARPGTAGGWAVGLGLVLTLFAVVMIPVAVSEWVWGFPWTLVIVGMMFGSGAALILGALWSPLLRALEGPPTAPGGPGSPEPPRRGP